MHFSEHIKFSPEELEKLQQLNQPIVLPQEVTTSSKITKSFKDFFSKASHELSEDAARFTESIKEGALEIKQKATQLKKETKDEAKTSQDVIAEEGEDGDQDDDDDDNDNDDDEEEDEDAAVETTDDTKVQSEVSTKTENTDTIEPSDQESVQEKAKARASTLMEALASGLQVAGLVAAGSPQEENKTLEGTLEAKEAVEDTSPKRFDEETLKKISEQQYDDLIVQPKPVKKKKKKTKGMMIL